MTLLISHSPIARESAGRKIRPARLLAAILVNVMYSSISVSINELTRFGFGVPETTTSTAHLSPRLRSIGGKPIIASDVPTAGLIVCRGWVELTTPYKVQPSLISTGLPASKWPLATSTGPTLSSDSVTRCGSSTGKSRKVTFRRLPAPAGAVGISGVDSRANRRRRRRVPQRRVVHMVIGMATTATIRAPSASQPSVVRVTKVSLPHEDR